MDVIYKFGYNEIILLIQKNVSNVYEVSPELDYYEMKPIEIQSYYSEDTLKGFRYMVASFKKNEKWHHIYYDEKAIMKLGDAYLREENLVDTKHKLVYSFVMIPEANPVKLANGMRLGHVDVHVSNWKKL